MFFSHNQHHFCSKSFRFKDSSNLNMFRKFFHVLFFPEVLSITFTRVWMHKKMYNFQGHRFSKQILVSIGQAKTYILYIYEYSIYLVISYSLLYNGVFWGLLWIITQNENVQKYINVLWIRKQTLWDMHLSLNGALYSMNNILAIESLHCTEIWWGRVIIFRYFTKHWIPFTEMKLNKTQNV